MDATTRDEVLEGLNVFRALESWGAALYAAWAEHGPLTPSCAPAISSSPSARRITRGSWRSACAPSAASRVPHASTRCSPSS